ncbi:MAG: phosphoribosylaminoimidazolesuccinocarboxamide synthase [Nanoarchaeota archaeon]|nr:phosphoribosylaminoimidazolesuccinocarboxamide synthase [Nanoarchaeota archaeon]
MAKSLENLALFETHNFPIRHHGNVHNGKVRSVYWLSLKDSARIIRERGYKVPKVTPLGIMITSDRVSAFDVVWQAKQGLRAVPGKGADLNIISKYWFDKFDNEGLAGNHILDIPHPLVWIVQKAEPVLVEGIARQYISGSMWRAYEKGIREFCGNILPDGLKKNQRLPELLLTPTTKGNLGHISGMPKGDDAKLTRQQILDHFKELGFKSVEDVFEFERLLREGYAVIERDLADIKQNLADDKKECGYVIDFVSGNPKMIYIDEVGTPDSSRFWDADAYSQGRIVENSKEPFRQFLLAQFDKDILLNDDRMPERRELARTYRVPVEEFMKISAIYKGIAEKITRQEVPKIENPREEILESLFNYGLVA